VPNTGRPNDRTENSRECVDPAEKGRAGQGARQGGAKLVPGGALVALLVDAFWKSPLERRSARWRERIEEAINELGARVDGLRIEVLAEDEAFTSVLLTATHVAMRTHQEERIRALRNCVLNAAVGLQPDHSIRQIFVELVDRLTPLHMGVLRLFQDPAANEGVAKAVGQLMTCGLSDIIEAAIPALPKQGQLVDLIWSDLASAGLIRSATLRGTGTAREMAAKRTSDLGDSFLQFVGSRR